MLNRSTVDLHAQQPDRRRAGSKTASEPAGAPVCDAAALAAASCRPALTTMIELVRATARAAQRGTRPNVADRFHV